MTFGYHVISKHSDLTLSCKLVANQLARRGLGKGKQSNTNANKLLTTFHTMDQTKEEEGEYGYGLFPERNKPKYKKGSIGESLFTFSHKCQVMLQFAMETSE